MRRPRRREPDQFLDITLRCHRSEFRFLPTKERTDAIGFWLAKAQARFPGVRVAAVCQMSNHIHLVVHDVHGQISGFLQYALGHLAKRINRLDRVRGAVFERRFAEIAVLDRSAFVDRIAYAITNPVAANLVRSHCEWAGLCLFAGDKPTSFPFTILHHGRYEEALRTGERTGAAVDQSEFQETVLLEIPAVDEDLARDITSAIGERETNLQNEGSAVLGMARVLEGMPFDRPEMSKRSRMPLCFASTQDLRDTFIEGWFAFVQAFREASSAFRRGILDTRFPLHSFRPSSSTV